MSSVSKAPIQTFVPNAANVSSPPSALALAFNTYISMFSRNFLVLALLFVLYMFSFVQRFE